MLPHEALAAAEAEGLNLATADCSTGYWGVQIITKSKKYRAQYRRPGVDKPIYVGQFACAEAAALALARQFPQAASVAAEAKAQKAAMAEKDRASAALTVEDVERIAADEGLTLLRDPTLSSATGGWRGVSVQKEKKHRPYQANRVGAGAKSSGSLGLFLTPHEAGLAVARALGPERSAAEAAKRRNGSGWALHDDHELSTEHATRLARDEGLTLRRKHNSADFWCVTTAKTESKPRWHARLNAGAQFGGYKTNGILYLGAFASPAAAALAIARHLRDHPELEARVQKLQQLARARAQRAPLPAAKVSARKKKRKRNAHLENGSESEDDYESEGKSESEGEGEARGEASSDVGGVGGIGGGTEPQPALEDAEVIEVEAWEMWSDDDEHEVPVVTAVAVA